jgi:hypothetical protein
LLFAMVFLPLVGCLLCRGGQEHRACHDRGGGEGGGNPATGGRKTGRGTRGGVPGAARRLRQKCSVIYKTNRYFQGEESPNFFIL